MFLLLLRMMITPDDNMLKSVKVGKHLYYAACIVVCFFSSTFGWRLLCHKAMHNLSDAKTIMLPGTSDRFGVLTVISVIACGNIAGK